VTSRARLLQQALGAFYYGLGFFVLTSVTIALAAFFNAYRWVPIPVGIIGIMFLFYGSLLMLRETWMATATVNAEMDFTWALANTVAPKEIIDKYTYNAHGKRRLRRTVLETLEEEEARKSG
jgi:threonine/homoserine/homoserine lactone efflux protein